MQSFFANFIIGGNPNGVSLPEWQAAEGSDPTPPVMVIDVQSRTIRAEHDDRYLFLDKTYKNN